LAAPLLPIQTQHVDFPGGEQELMTLENNFHVLLSGFPPNQISGEAPQAFWGSLIFFLI